LEVIVPARRSIWRAAWDQPIFVLTLTALIWAGHAVVDRLAVGQIAPMTLTTGRWALALGPIMYIARRTLRRDLKALRPRWIFVAGMGTLGFTAFNALFYISAHYTSVINISLIQGSIPALVLLGAWAVFRDPVGPLQICGAVATIAGVAVIAAQGDLSRLAGLAVNQGDALMLIASVLYAGYTVGLRDRLSVSAFGFLAGMALAALASSLPLFVAEVWLGAFIWPTLTGYAILAYAALGPALFAQLLYMRGVELIGPGRAGVFVNLVPVFGALMAVALLGEPFKSFHLVALILVVGGIAIAQRAPRK
jgi:drug/metabolite transporter (DMT)-like permease